MGSINIFAVLLSAAALVAVFRFKIGMIRVLAACSAAGVLAYLAAGALG